MGEETEIRNGSPKMWTIGHSTHSFPELLGMLGSFGVVHLVDVRTIPRSGHNPQFNREALVAELRRSGIAYSHAPSLGGLRKPRPDSTNMGWRNLSFRGYADHMETGDFVAGLKGLIREASEGHLAVMCAEALPWRCHRSLLSDALVLRGCRVNHIMDTGVAAPHRLTPGCVAHDGRPTYPSKSMGPTLHDFENTTGLPSRTRASRNSDTTAGLR
jgi:uncharacterized protein (DUF488 family)